jgi:drug/metabolite transporter (DMT)-like permease
VTWLFLAAGAAFFYALHGAWSKRVAVGVGPVVAAWALFAFSLPLFLLYLAFSGVPDPGPRFWWVLGVNAVLNLGSAALFFAALRAGDLGITFPLLALTPLFVIPVEWALLGVLPGAWGVVGIVLMVTGIYLLNFGERGAGFLAPLAALLRSPGARMALGVALVWSVTGTLDRVAVLESSPAFYGSWLAGSLTLLFPPLILLERWRNGRRGVASPTLPPGRLARLLPVHGLLFAAMYVLQMEALRLALASYVLSVKRTGAILAVILGWAAFQEAALHRRLLGTLITVSGAAVLVIWG